MSTFEIIAKTLFGFEELLAEELTQIGAKNIQKLNRAVKYDGNLSVLYKSNLYLRTALKILRPIGNFEVHNEQDLYDAIRRIRWDSYIHVGQTIAVEGYSSSEKFTHSQYIALKTKDAIVDQFRNRYGARPSVDTINPDLKVNIHITGNTCTVSLDSSGQSLGRRGYKTAQTAAPLSEVLAAGIIMLTNWDRKSVFLDPMCGSGTFPIEAALLSSGIAPGLFRSFAFERWKDHDKNMWKQLREEAKQGMRTKDMNIMGKDREQRAVEIAKDNAARAGFSDNIRFEKKDFLQTKAEYPKGILVINPPYGERLEEKERMMVFYNTLGDHLKQNYSGWDAWIFTGNLDAAKQIGLRPSRRIKLFNGPIECKLLHFSLYEGSKKLQIKKH